MSELNSPGGEIVLTEQCPRMQSRVEVVPASTPAADVLARNPDGVFLSNGPGDPAMVPYAVDAIRDLLGNVPVFGICLGHQLLGRAIGADTVKLPFGHHGGNHPVRRLRDGVVEITSQNHNFAVVEGVPGATVTHRNLNDGVVEGIAADGVPAFSVQHHPEAGPGPHDSSYLFTDFAELMDRHRSGGGASTTLVTTGFKGYGEPEPEGLEAGHGTSMTTNVVILGAEPILDEE